MIKYRFMYDTGVSMVVPFDNADQADAFANASPDNLMFYYIEEEDNT